MKNPNTALPLISVLMTVYNREQFLAEAIESVLDSTYQNWELIITDDRSTDNSLTIAKQYAAKDTRIKVYLNDENLGDYPNRNKAASYAKGTYLKYVDADDMIYPYGLEQLVYYMEQFPDAGYGLCSLKQDKNQLYPISLSPLETYERHYLGAGENSIFHKAPLSSIIRREVFEAEGGFKPVRHYGDFELWHRLSQSYNVVLMPIGIVWYRVSDGQEAAIRKKNPMNALHTLNAAVEHISSEQNPLSEVQKTKVLENLTKVKSKIAISVFKRHGFKKGMEFKSASGVSFFDMIKNRFFS